MSIKEVFKMADVRAIFCGIHQYIASLNILPNIKYGHHNYSGRKALDHGDEWA